MKNIFKLLLLVVVLHMTSCEDILEENITNDTVQPTYPQEGSIVESNVTSFQWNSLKGADKYRVQVYKNTAFKVFDTLVNNASGIILPLPQGTYQWRIRGENSAYESTYSFPITFQVQESQNLENQQVVLTSPINNYATNQNTITLSWNELTNADYYKIEVQNLTDTNIILTQDNYTSTNIVVNNLQENKEYSWKVKAVNTTTNTETPFAIRGFIMDAVAPNQPQNSLPSNNATQSQNQVVTFSWTISSDTGAVQSPLSYEVQIATDNNFTTNVQTLLSQNLSVQYSFANAGVYYWRVRAKDSAGNLGNYSNSFKITIN